MHNYSDFVVKRKNIILIIGLLFIIPTLIGFLLTKTNYDILLYLPSDIETLKGQKILKEDFNIGSFSVSLVDNSVSEKELIKLENKIREIDCVNEVISINDITGTTIPLEMLPKKIVERVTSKDSKLLIITFSTGTSDEETTNAVSKIEKLSSDIKVGGMSAMALDMQRLVENQMSEYIIIAAICCLLVLMVSLDSYFVPLILLGNIGISILFNMGTNMMFGEISYITKGIASVLQLGVTTDFSIFLYHKYEAAKKNNKSNDAAMSDAISETMVSVIGSSLTTIAGFLALCSMKFGLGKDIGLVMAKGVLFGVLTVLTIYPSLLLIFDKLIQKTKHKPIIPEFKFVKPFVLKNYKWIFIVFLILLVPAYLSQKNTSVYYKLDASIPDDYNYSIVSRKLKSDYGLISQSMILVNSNIDNSIINNMIDEINRLDGIDSVLSTNLFNKYGISSDIIPLKIKHVLETDKYKMILVNSNYGIATDELNDQISKLNTIIKKYDKNAILAGEGPLMNDLVEITAIDFKNVNYVSIGVIFLIMFFVLKSVSLPVLLVLSIEFAIFINMGVPYWRGTSIPFVSSIVIGTIQLGATIDYAILLTTKYLNERKKGKEKKLAMEESLTTSVSSIFVSAMCFFAATFGVYFISKIDMIGSICLLIARGAIISMIVVMFVVPSVLLTFDKLIIKTTQGFKKGMKLKMKKVLSYVLILCILFETTSICALTKEENVYAKLKSTGEIENISISERLYNYAGKNISDKSVLSSIKNINGNEKYKQSENDIVWETKGNDIYYQGVYKGDLPISIKVKYFLNGEEKKIDEILGKKGKIKIVLTYENDSYKDMDINGNIEKIYTPYMILTSTILNNTDNKNIKVNNGKIINNGISSIVMAISSPGLYESLNISKLKDINKVEISYDTDDFELNSIYSVASSDLLKDVNLDMFKKIDDLYKNINLLQTNMDIIVDGSKKLSDGSSQMNEGVTLLNSKIQELVNKYKYYRNKDKNELKEELIGVASKSISLIAPALEEDVTNEASKLIKENKEELEESVVYYTKQNTKEVIDEEITKIINKLDINNILEQIINSNLVNLLKNDQDIINLKNMFREELNNELNNIINEINDSISVNMSDSEKEQYINSIVSDYGVTYDQALGIVEKVQSDTLNQVKNNINIKIEEKINNQDSLNTLINEYINNLNLKLSEALNRETTISEFALELKEKIKEAIYKDLENEDVYINLNIKEYISNLVNKIIDNTAHDLSSKYTEEYTNKVVKNIIEKQFSDENVDSKLRELLNNYEDSINEKIVSLDDKIYTLSDSLNKLNDGSKQISDGMNTLSLGLERYNKEGINKISQLVNGDVKSIQNRLDALVKLSKANNLVDNIPEGASGNSKIIYMIDSMQKKENTKKETIKEEKKNTLWDKIKGLFN